MENTTIAVFLLTACIILLVKKILIANIDSRFAISDQIKESILVYKRAFLYLKYRISTKKRCSFKEWAEAQEEANHE